MRAALISHFHPGRRWAQTGVAEFLLGSWLLAVYALLMWIPERAWGPAGVLLLALSFFVPPVARRLNRTLTRGRPEVDPPARKRPARWVRIMAALIAAAVLGCCLTPFPAGTFWRRVCYSALALLSVFLATRSLSSGSPRRFCAEAAFCALVGTSMAVFLPPFGLGVSAFAALSGLTLLMGGAHALIRFWARGA
jgi:hypothetical protein